MSKRFTLIVSSSSLTFNKAVHFLYDVYSFVGSGIRFTPPNGVFGWQHLSMLELRYGHYVRSTGLNSDIITLNLKFK